MNDPRNPYAPPNTHVADHEESPSSTDSGRFIPYGRSLPPGRGAGWIGDAWRLLRARPGMWAAALLLLFIAYMIVSMIPLVGMFVQLLAPFAYAGIAMAADQQRRTGTFELEALLIGFQKQPASLLVVGATVIGASIVFIMVLAVFIGADIFTMIMSGAKSVPSTLLTAKFFLAFLIGLVIMIPVGLATYLAPQLIILHDQPALTAMKMSLIGAIKNILPGLVFLLCGLILLVLSMIPLLLGLLITIPIMVLTNYTVYRDIFVEENP